MTVLFILFLGIATLLWLSLFGYLLTLAYLAYRRPRNEQDISTFPEVAILIPALNAAFCPIEKSVNISRCNSNSSPCPPSIIFRLKYTLDELLSEATRTGLSPVPTRTFRYSRLTRGLYEDVSSRTTSAMSP